MNRDSISRNAWSRPVTDALPALNSQVGVYTRLSCGLIRYSLFISSDCTDGEIRLMGGSTDVSIRWSMPMLYATDTDGAVIIFMQFYLLCY